MSAWWEAIMVEALIPCAARSGNTAAAVLLSWNVAAPVLTPETAKPNVFGRAATLTRFVGDWPAVLVLTPDADAVVLCRVVSCSSAEAAVATGIWVGPEITGSPF